MVDIFIFLVIKAVIKAFEVIIVGGGRLYRPNFL